MKIRALSLVIIAGLNLWPVASRAQFALSTPTPTPTPPPSEESIIVVGENLPGDEENGPDPIITIDRDQIDKAGELTTGDLLRDTTVSGPNGVPTSNNATGYTPGAASISLRGFDPGETLVLVDGKRVGNYPIALGTQTFVDLNSISASTISEVEIVTDSASAEYGADAVAGVVNIKLRHDYRGAETDVEYGNTLDKDSGEFSAALLFGVGDKNSDVSGALNYYQRNSILSSDRAYSAVTFNPSANTSPANLELSRAAVVAAGGDPSGGLGDDFIGRPPSFNHGDAPASNYSYQLGRTRDFNFNAYVTGFPASEKYGGFVNATHRIFGDQMVLSADFNYQDARTRYDLAPAATGGFQTPDLPTLAIPPHAPGATPGGPSYADTGVSLGAFNPFNPFQQIISGQSEARLFDFGDRVIDAETKAWFTTFDLKGDKLFDGHWSYDAGFRDSEVGNTSSGTNVSASRFDRVLNAADPIFDPTSKQYIGTTIPYDPFGDFRVPIASNAPSIAFATIHPVENDFSNQIEADLDFRTSELFHLPAGGIALGFGLQFRRESIKQEPDKLIQSDIVGSGFETFVEASRNAGAAYAKLSVPVFGPSFNFAGLRALDFTAAFRFEEFADDTNNAVVPKFGLRWQPFEPSLTIRATWSEGFYEPTLFELYGNPVSSMADLLDPVKNTTVYNVPTLLRSNPALQPGDSRSFSSGIVFKPRFVPGLTISADIFDIESLGRVNAPDLDDVLQRAALGRSAPGEEVFRDPSGNLQFVQFAYQNGGSEKARGVDFAFQYQLATSWGTITSLTRASYLSSFSFADLPGDREMELTGGTYNADDPYLQWRATSQLEWFWHHFDALLTCHYLEGFHETLPYTIDDEHWVAGRALFDLQLSYRFAFAIPREDRPVPGYSRPATDNAGDAKSPPAELDSEPINTSVQSSLWKRLLHGTTLTFGVNNLFGQDPPVAFADFSDVNYPANIYNSTGRFLYASIKKKF
ncbi:MAG TPA: TonB-dependent receptor plug domain-containing protein [Chthoniobacterales bacterium]|nr:TonB-dependent receptor plug domain-containing protein [Chthoniobacterales bacterium]